LIDTRYEAIVDEDFNIRVLITTLVHFLRETKIRWERKKRLSPQSNCLIRAAATDLILDFT